MSTLTEKIERMERIARVAHEVNRAYCQALGDKNQPISLAAVLIA